MAKRKTQKSKRPSSSKKRSAPHLDFPCLSFSQGSETLVAFTGSAKDLWSVTEINRREEDKDQGYQRVLSPYRAAKIGKFIDAGNLIPNSVLISFDANRASLDDSGSRLRVSNVPNAGWVIDGQHRLAGAHRAERDIVLPVVGFIGLPLEKQINCFVTINREQKGVPSSLYFDLLRHLPPTKTEKELTQERAADLGTAMKLDEESPFYAKIVVTTSPKQGEISMTNFVRKVAPLIRRDGRLYVFNDDDRKTLLGNYYRALAQVFPTEYSKQNSIFFKTLGFGALMNVLPTFLDMTVNQYGGFTVADAISTFKRVRDFDFGLWVERGTGTQAENSASEDLRTALVDSLEEGQTFIKLR